MKIRDLDHFVLTVTDLDKTIDFYTRILGMRLLEFGEGRKGLAYANYKINLHKVGQEYEPKAKNPTPGAADLCFIVESEIEEVRSWLESLGVKIILGPVTRTGSQGIITSVYIHDPDKNLIELSTY